MSKVYALISPEQSRNGEIFIPETQIMKAYIHFMDGSFEPKYMNINDRDFVIHANREFERFVKIERGVKVKYVTIGEIQISLSRRHMLELMENKDLTERTLRKYVGTLYPHNNINIKKINILFNCIKRMRENQSAEKNVFEFLGKNEEYHIQTLNNRLGVIVEMNRAEDGKIHSTVHGPMIIKKGKSPLNWTTVNWGMKQRQFGAPVIDADTAEQLVANG